MLNQVAKKVMSVALAATIAIAPYSTAFASGNSGNSGNTATAASSSSSAEDPAAAIQARNIAGSTVLGVRSTTPGTYFASTPVATTASLAEIAAALGLTGTERPYITTWDVTAKNAPAAAAALQAAAASIGATVGPMLQINLNKMVGGKLTALTNGATINAKLLIPANFRGGSSYVVIKVVSGGAVTILEDQDTNPNTVTVAISAGNAAYAIARR